MKIKSAEFWAAAPNPGAIPRARHPEIALAGRSNVGKSSLINRLAARKRLARTSRTPGCTRGLIFYAINESISLVDLPGYGYASRSRAERAGWKTLVQGYLATREELAGVLQLVDVRRGPQDEERILADFLDAHGVARGWVATKCDKLARGKLARAVAALERDAAPAPVIATCATTGQGMDEVWKWAWAAVDSPLLEEDDLG